MAGDYRFSPRIELLDHELPGFQLHKRSAMPFRGRNNPVTKNVQFAHCSRRSITTAIGAYQDFRAMYEAM